MSDLSTYYVKLFGWALVWAAGIYVLARAIRGPSVGWQTPAVVAAVVLVEGWRGRRQQTTRGARADEGT